MTAEFDGRTLLVTGGRGFLGTQVVRDLVDGFPGRIVSVHRQQGSRLAAPHVELRCDLRDEDNWHGLLREADYVLWMAALRDHTASTANAERQNVAPLRAAVRTLRESPRLRRLVYMSSISAVDQPWHPDRPRPIDDEAVANPYTPYGHSKLAAEAVLADSGLPHTVLRLPFLYGPGFRQGSFLDFYRRAANNRLLSAVRYTAKLSVLYTGDMAGLVLDVLASRNAPQADASPYVVSDGEVYQVDELVNAVARLHGLHRPERRVPAAVSRFLSTAALHARAWLRPESIRRGHCHLLASYWSHAAFTSDYFTVDSSRFRSAFPDCTFTPIEVGLARAFGESAR